METPSLTAILAGSSPDCALAAGNNLRIDLASIAHAGPAEAEWAVGVDDNGSIRRVEGPSRGLERPTMIRLRNDSPGHLSGRQLCTLVALSSTSFAGSTRLSTTAAPGCSSLSQL
jgi:hypothetical protein